MPEVEACRYPNAAACPDVSASDPSADTSRHAFDLVRDSHDHEIDTTASRQLRRGADFRATAQFMIGAGFHPKAGPSTLRLAELLASRMHRSVQGHVPFNVTATMKALGLKRRAVLNHARYLRELGLLAYIEHGSRANVLRTRGSWQPGDGYAGTATIFAPVAPPVWDHALGRRIDGRGYRARIIGVTDHGRTLAVQEARRTAKTRKTERRTSCTPSLVVPQDHRQLKVMGGSNYTPRQRATCPTNPPAPQQQPRVRPQDCARGIAAAEQLQREIWWLHRGCSRKLGYALRPLLAEGWTLPSLVAELRTWGVPGFLRNPAAYVRHEIARRQHAGDLLRPVPPADAPQADEDGHQHAAMLQQRQQHGDPRWKRYATELRPQLRRQLAEIRQRRKAPGAESAVAANRPRLREDEAVFEQALPLQARSADLRPTDIYRARAHGRPDPVRPLDAAADRGWLAHLKDELEAERAFAALRISLAEAGIPVQ